MAEHWGRRPVITGPARTDRMPRPSPEEDLALLRGFLSSAELHHALAAGEDRSPADVTEVGVRFGSGHGCVGGFSMFLL